MSIFKADYTIDVDKGVDETKQLFEKQFDNMQKRGYSGSLIVLNPDYGTKKFTGIIDNDGTYKVRLIVSPETDWFYRGAPVNRIRFSGDWFNTKVSVSVNTVTYAVISLILLAVAVLLLTISVVYFIEIASLVVSAVMFIFCVITIIVAKRRVNAAKEELIYILKYSEKYQNEKHC